MLFRKKKENPFVDVKEALILKEHYKTINNELLEENQLLTQQIESLTAQLAELKKEQDTTLKQFQCYKAEIFNLKEETSKIYSEACNTKEVAEKEYTKRLEKFEAESRIQSKIIDYYSKKSRQLLLREESLLEDGVITQLFRTLADLRNILLELVNGLYTGKVKLEMNPYKKNTFDTSSLRSFVKQIEAKLTQFETIFIQNGHLPYYCDTIKSIYEFTKTLRDSYNLNTSFLYDGKLLRFVVDTFETEIDIASTSFQKNKIIHLRAMYKLLVEKRIDVADYNNFEAEFYELAYKGKLPLDLVTAKLFQHEIPFVLENGANKLNWDFKLLKRFSYKKTFYIMGCLDSKIFKYGVSINDAMSRFKEHSRVAEYNGLTNFKLLKEFKTRNAMNVEQYLNKKFIGEKWSENPEKAHSLEWIILKDDTEVNYLLHDMWQQDEELKRILFFNPSLSSTKAKYTN
ncbi:hypothetical protein COL13_13220 [Bacillus cereus]|nr:hypothetical protein COL13_13220 [Bacillus cereus]